MSTVVGKSISLTLDEIADIRRAQFPDSIAAIRQDEAFIEKIDTRCKSPQKEDSRVWMTSTEINQLRRLANLKEQTKRKNKRVKIRTVSFQLGIARERIEQRIGALVAKTLAPEQKFDPDLLKQWSQAIHQQAGNSFARRMMNNQQP